jgi:hypothetical protein
MLDQLKARDREVRAHEAAHLAAAGRYATSGASYTYQKGPDGMAYAIGGEVNIDVSPVPNDPEATIQKADTIIRAATAAAEPSDQDLKVAQSARQMRVQAMAARTEQTQEETKQADQEDQIQQQQKEAAEQEAQTTSSTQASDIPAAMLVIGDTISWLERVAKNRYESVFGVLISTNIRNTIGFNVFA